jgi:hypothetical protein
LITSTSGCFPSQFAKLPADRTGNNQLPAAAPNP